MGIYAGYMLYGDVLVAKSTFTLSSNNIAHIIQYTVFFIIPRCKYVQVIWSHVVFGLVRINFPVVNHNIVVCYVVKLCL